MPANQSPPTFISATDLGDFIEVLLKYQTKPVGELIAPAIDFFAADGLIPNDEIHGILAHTPYPEVRQWAALGKTLDFSEARDMLSRAKEGGDTASIYNMASNSMFPSDLHREIVRDYPELSEVVAAATNEAELLEELAVSPDYVTRTAVADNRSTPAAVLAILAKDDYYGARRNVATNPNTETEVLQQLLSDAHEKVSAAAVHFLEK